MVALVPQGETLQRAENWRADVGPPTGTGTLAASPGGSALRVLGRIRDTRLSPAAKATGAMIVSRFNRAGAAWPSLRTLAADTGLDRRTVRRALGELEAAGILRLGCRCGKPAADCDWRGRTHGPLFTAADGPALEVHTGRTNPAPNGAKKYTGGTSRSTPGALSSPPPLSIPPLKVLSEDAQAGARRTSDLSIDEVEAGRRLRKAVGRQWADLALEEVRAREVHGLPVLSRWALAREIAECYRGQCRDRCHSELHGPEALSYHAGRRADWEQEARTRHRGPTSTLDQDDDGLEAERRRQHAGLYALEAQAVTVTAADITVTIGDDDDGPGRYTVPADEVGPAEVPAEPFTVPADDEGGAVPAVAQRIAGLMRAGRWTDAARWDTIGNLQSYQQEPTLTLARRLAKGRR